MKGIDLSGWQTNVDYMKLKANGIEFAILRCGYGRHAGQKDIEFETHYRGCKYAGIKIGAYLYSYASTVEGARAELKNCLDFIYGKSFDLPIFYDLEDEKTTGKASRETITEMAKIFCEGIKNAGYNAGVYANLYWFTSKMNVSELEKYNIWLAQWGVSKPTASFKYDIWQYTSKGQVDGIKGNVDIDILYNVVENGGNYVENPNIEELAQAVIRGEYGNGEERKQKLGNLYEQVQARVNEILSQNVSKETIYIVQPRRYIIGYCKKIRDNISKNCERQ
jgi:GH25 family lysozyme M1 (1,4-beta-N-acetylmuramidase)